ncbi:MAG: 4Fe-4S dicluster domain-containing protein [Deltaproteobacteria bacterium]|nr:4Fe-4S dicluster domain-containing protein [Deltaproteobacteria bacterium]MBZ0219529.1 4Fe-4S dicluster domain-containing protein [Deltaproteobacteria bacterium]
MENILRQKAKELLTSGEVKVVIGYGWNRTKTRTTPVFITDPVDADQLVWNPLCVNNLSVYLTRKFKDIQALGKPAIVAKGCDIRNIAVLISEAQIKREDVYIVGMTCQGVVYKQDLWQGELKPNIMPTKCHNCDVRNPHLSDFVVGDKVDFAPPEEPTGMVFDKIKDLDSKSSSERWTFWINEFSRCIKCYACRQVCSLCYCERCITEKNMPQWIETSAHPRGNLSWNLIRAMHLTGRCTFCGECERACPVNIPLNLMNQKMIMVVKDAFDFKSGYDEKAHPPMIVFSPDDKENFIK